MKMSILISQNYEVVIEVGAKITFVMLLCHNSALIKQYTSKVKLILAKTNSKNGVYTMKKRILLIVLMAIGFTFSSCAKNTEETKDVIVQEEKTQEPVSQEVFAMDTYMTITAYGENANEVVEQSIAEIERLDQLLTATADSGEVYVVNQSGGGTLSEDSMYLMERSMELYQDTEGAFDVTIFPVMEAWGFVSDEFAVPSEAELQKKLQLVDMDKVEINLESSSVDFKKDGMAIDFGGIAKGYTSTRIADIFRKEGVEHGLINLGGNVHVVGTKADGTKWKVGIQSPDESEEYIGVLQVSDCAVITSGGYERYFEEEGITYHHIIDPSTGYPAENGLISVTIISKDGTLADGLSTSLYIMGLENAKEFWQKHCDEFDAILLTENGELFITEGIVEDFTAKLEINVIKKEN